MKQYQFISASVRNISVLTVLLFSCSSEKDSTIPQVKPLMEAVYASGFVTANNEYQITAQVDGYLTTILVREGETIKKDQPLFVIESSQQNARAAISRESYQLARENYQSDSPVLAEMEAAVATAKTKVSFDSINYLRYKNLIQQKATTQIEFDRMQLTYENSKNEYRLQVNRYKKTKNQLRMEYENAQRQLDIANEESSRYVVKSEVDGKLFTTYKEKNELVKRGEVIAVVGDAHSFYLKLSVDEMDVKKIQVGQEAMVKIDAFGDQIFKAKLDRIYPLINTREQAIRVDALFVDLKEILYSGLAVEANIIIRQKKDALVIPRKYLTEGDSLLVMRNGNKEKVKVTTGIATLDEVEIVHGLSKEEVIKLK